MRIIMKHNKRDSWGRFEKKNVVKVVIPSPIEREITLDGITYISKITTEEIGTCKGCIFYDSNGHPSNNCKETCKAFLFKSCLPEGYTDNKYRIWVKKEEAMKTSPTIENEIIIDGIKYISKIATENAGSCRGCELEGFKCANSLVGMIKCLPNDYRDNKYRIWVKKEVEEEPNPIGVKIAKYILNHYDKNSHKDHIALAKYLDTWRKSCKEEGLRETLIVLEKATRETLISLEKLTNDIKKRLGE